MEMKASAQRLGRQTLSMERQASVNLRPSMARQEKERGYGYLG
jgi:hypothetical protein